MFLQRARRRAGSKKSLSGLGPWALMGMLLGGCSCWVSEGSGLEKWERLFFQSWTWDSFLLDFSTSCQLATDPHWS